MISTLATNGPAPPFRSRSRPELPVVAALAVLGLVCAGVWWSGAVAPRVTAVVRSIEMGSIGGGPGTIAIDFENDGPLGVELRQPSLSVNSGAPVVVLAVRVNGRDLGSGARLEAGQAARIEVVYAFDCRGPGAIGADPAIFLRVSGALGVTRTRQANTLALERGRSGGDHSRDPGPLLCPFAVPLAVP